MPRPLFYAFKNALRFDLGGDEEVLLPRFLQSLDRARAVVRELFADQEHVTIALCSWGDPDRAPTLADDELLPAAGLDPAIFSGPERVQTPEQREEQIASYWRFAEVEARPRVWEGLLSGALAIGQVRPTAQFEVFLIDFERGLIVLPYDDRGMDVVALGPEPLIPIYRRFGDWLLDYDRERMDAKFGPLSVAKGDDAR